jgi:hypothetical protein
MSESVKGSNCSYVSLSNYNSSAPGMLGSPVQNANTVTGSYVVPNYSAIGYGALTHDASTPSCSGYFSVTNAYGADANTCSTQFNNLPCDQ